MYEFLTPSVWLSLQLWSADQLSSGKYTAGVVPLNYMAAVVQVKVISRGGGGLVIYTQRAYY